MKTKSIFLTGYCLLLLSLAGYGQIGVNSIEKTGFSDAEPKNNLTGLNTYCFEISSDLYDICVIKEASFLATAGKSLIGHEIPKRFFDIGFGLGLDYGGLIGTKLSFLPIQHISLFGAAGLQLLGFGWNVGSTLHLLPENSKHAVRPNVKIMYGINRLTKIVGASEYDKMFTGWTPGVGLKLMFGKEKANGMAIDINFPIGSQEFKDKMEKIDNDPRVEITFFLPVAFSIGYHRKF